MLICRKSARALVVLGVLTTAALVAEPVNAQGVVVGGPTEPSIDVQNFQAVASPHAVFSVESAQASEHLGFSAGFLLNFANKPLVLETDAGEEEAIIENQLGGDVLLALGLFDLAEISAAFPVYFVNGVSEGGLSPDAASGATIGDLRMRGKFSLLSPQKDVVGVAPYVQVGFPTGDDGAFASSGGFYARPGLIVDALLGPVLVALNLSANLQGEREYANISVGNQLVFGLGTQLEVVPQTFFVGAEVFGSSGFDEFFGNRDELPLEGLVGVKYRTPIGINFELGGGAGLVPGFGSPAFRVIGGLRYAVYDNDLDDDGVLDDIDECTSEAEDRDGFEDDDGCPDDDNDNDAIPDAVDNCPLEAEDYDDFQDDDGCPEPDNDNDNIPDGEDACPNEAGTLADKGCPNLDIDGDGFENQFDPCPEQAEDMDGFQDEDGCPEPDNDLDGVLDPNDRCPDKKEDLDGFEDEDGCPDEDNDGDGILDVDDKCPLRKGSKKWDGCPGKKKVVVVGDEIRILDKVFFDTGKASIKKKSFDLLQEVADTLKSNPMITKIEVQGHTDDVGSDKGNLKLSQGRAESVVARLVEQGVASERLVAKGYGESAPEVAIEGLKGRNLKKARESNRRVQFKILEQDRKTKVIEVAPDSE